MSNPGLRFYSGSDNSLKVKDNLGIEIISTLKRVTTNFKAKELGIGDENQRKLNYIKTITDTMMDNTSNQKMNTLHEVDNLLDYLRNILRGLWLYLYITIYSSRILLHFKCIRNIYYSLRILLHFKCIRNIYY